MSGRQFCDENGIFWCRNGVVNGLSQREWQFCGKILQICLPGTSGATFFLFLELLFLAFEICIKFLRSLP